jgi:hypothetical protein
MEPVKKEWSGSEKSGAGKKRVERLRKVFTGEKKD